MYWVCFRKELSCQVTIQVLLFRELHVASCLSLELKKDFDTLQGQRL
jgi:hypothetical protein